MEFSPLMDASHREARSTQDFVTQGTHIKKIMRGGQQTVKRVDNKNMSM
jgi:hypothetical protein